jgi:hypothetical protein
MMMVVFATCVVVCVYLHYGKGNCLGLLLLLFFFHRYC